MIVVRHGLQDVMVTFAVVLRAHESMLFNVIIGAAVQVGQNVCARVV